MRTILPRRPPAVLPRIICSASGGEVNKVRIKRARRAKPQTFDSKTRSKVKQKCTKLTRLHVRCCISSSAISSMRPPTQFGDTVAAEAENEPDPRMMSMMICTRLAGRAVIRVVDRCNEAQGNSNLDLSNCQLMQVPDAVYHLMRHTELKTCDLSDNVITKIPPKFAVKFSTITDLNLSHNQMAKLPDEIADLGALERLDISHNTFISLPNCIFKINKLQHLNASNNHIIDVDVECLEEAPSLEVVDLTQNPLSVRCHDHLSSVSRIRITVTPREKEDWEDLTI